MTKMEIEQWLDANCANGTRSECCDGTGLTKLHQMLFHHKSNVKKPDMIRDLAEFYSHKQNIFDIWNGADNELGHADGLNETEKAFVTVAVQYDGVEFKPTTKTLAKQYGIEPKPDERYTWTRTKPYYDMERRRLLFLHLLKAAYPHTRTVAFFPGGDKMPPFVLSALKEIVPPMKFEYSAFAPAKTDYVVCRENRLSDFAAVVRFAGSEQLKVKEGTFDITKSKLAKMAESIGFEEICDNNGKFATPKDVKRNNDFRVALPLFVLSASGGLLEISRDLTVKPSGDAVKLLSLPTHELAKELFKSYMKTIDPNWSKFSVSAYFNDIYELHYLTYLTARDGERFLHWPACRKPIIDLLKTCPIGAFVSFEDFEKYAHIFCGNFFRKLLNCRVYVSGVDFGDGYWGGCEPDWEDCERRIIWLILSFLNALGMVDLAYTENAPFLESYGIEIKLVGVSGFRVTNLGAWILGMTETYDAPNEVAQTAEGDILVQPDHTVMISGLKKRVEHETYLSKFLTKASVDDNVAVYKIDFAGMVKAYDQKITPTQIKAYLKKATDKPLPENVLRSLDDWQTKVGRVKIRTVTILEADDDLLLQELLHLKGMDNYTDGALEHAAVITADSPKKVKALAEKGGWLVKI